jgi:hypothetical protein
MQNQGGLASRQMLVTAAGSENFKPVFKEKFVSLYEDIFALRSPLQSAKDQGIQGRVAIGRFWDELLLLKVQSSYHLIIFFKVIRNLTDANGVSELLRSSHVTAETLVLQ